MAKGHPEEVSTEEEFALIIGGEGWGKEKHFTEKLSGELRVEEI
jgi:hypothetical protein